MTITNLNPWHVLDQIHQDNLRRHAKAGQRWQPPVDIVEMQDRYEIHLDLPGVKPEQVQVELEDSTLKISGEKTRKQEEAASYRYKERATGNFARNFKLPEDANPTGVSAQFDNGVLVLTIQKQEATKPRRIEIQTN